MSIKRSFLISKSYQTVRMVHFLVLSIYILGLDKFNNTLSLIFLSMVLSFFAMSVGVNIINHRFCAHKSFLLGTFGTNIFLFFHSYVGLNSPITSSVMHEAHHQNSDKTNDPHPYPKEFWRRIVFPVKIYFHMLVTKPRLTQIMRYSRRSGFVFHHKYGAVLSLMASLTLYMIGIEYLFYLQTVPIMFAAFTHYLLAGPMHGKKHLNIDTRDYSIDSPVLNILSAGEGNHHLHHRYPKKIYFSRNEFKRSILLFDLTGYLITKLFQNNEKQ